MDITLRQEFPSKPCKVLFKITSESQDRGAIALQRARLEIRPMKIWEIRNVGEKAHEIGCVRPSPRRRAYDARSRGGTDSYFPSDSVRKEGIRAVAVLAQTRSLRGARPPEAGAEIRRYSVQAKLILINTGRSGTRCCCSCCPE